MIRNAKKISGPSIEDRESPADLKKDDLLVVARGGGLVLFGTAFGRGLWFLSQLLIARLLGHHVFGLYALGFAVSKVVELISTGGLHFGAVRFISIYREKEPSKVKGMLVMSLVLPLLFGFLFALLLFLCSGYLAENVFHEPPLKKLIQFFACSIPFGAALTVVSNSTTGFLTNKYSVLMREVVQPLLNLFFLYLLVHAGYGAYGAVWGLNFSYVGALLIGLFLIRKMVPRKKARFEPRPLLLYSLPLLFTAFFGFLFAWVDMFLLGIMATAGEAGVYRAASQVTFVMTMLLLAANSLYAPMAASLHTAGEMERLRALYRRVSEWLYAIVLPLLLFILFSAGPIMGLFGEEFIREGRAPLLILSIGQFVNCITGGVGSTLIMTGRQKVEFLNSFFMLALDVGLNLFLIPEFGITGTALAGSLSLILVNGLRVIEAKRIYGMHPFTQEHLGFLFPGIISALLLSFVFLKGVEGLLALSLNFLIPALVFGIYFSLKRRPFLSGRTEGVHYVHPCRAEGRGHSAQEAHEKGK
jgi:O-antigen/teichoic acid export membrane protein